MSLDRSLKSGSSLAQHRSVLTRAERIAKMRADGTFTAEGQPLALPKTISPRVAVRKKVKVKKAEEGVEGEAGAAAPVAAAPAAPAAKGKK